MIPAKVKVGPYTYSVVCQSIIDNAGIHQRALQRLVIDADGGPDARRDVLIHELLHAILSNAGTDQDGDEARKATEAFIERVSAGLLGVIRDNPDLIAYLTEKDE